MDKKKIQDIYPLTPAQEGILFHCLAEPEASLYWNQNSFILTGTLDHGAFKAAWDLVMQRHDALRAVFNWDNPKRPLQIIVRSVDLSWRELDWRWKDSGQQERLFEDLLQRDRDRGCDLRRSPLMRHYLIRLDDEKWRFLWGNHHILLDGWSVSVVFKDLFSHYSRIARGTAEPAPARSSFRSHIDWLQSRDPEPARKFFEHYLEGIEEPTPLPSSPHAMAFRRRGSGYSEKKVRLSADILEQLSSNSRFHKLTLNRVLQGLWGLLLSIHSGRRDVVFGSVYSGRTSGLPDIDRMVGLFINALPVRLEIRPEDSFPQWLAGYASTLAACQDFQHAPLRAVQKCTSIPADRPIFESLFVFENYPDRFGTQPPTEDLEVSKVRSDERDNYPLTFLVLVDEGIDLVLCYDTERFPERTIGRILDHMSVMVSRLADDFTLPLKSLRELPPGQMEELVAFSISSNLPSAAPATLDAMACHPDHSGTAVIAAGTRISTADLETLVSSWARIQVFNEEDRVGLCFDRSAGMVVAMLAIIRSGAAYVPIDPGWPEERIRYIITDAGLRVVVAGKGRACSAVQKAISPLKEEESVRLVEMDATSPVEPDGPVISDPTPPGPDSLAYVIYTSGSTGNPKGVLVEHRNAASSTLARMAYYPTSPARFLLLSPVFFDSSVAGLFWTLASAGTLILPEPEMEKDPERLADLIMREKITHFLCLPSLYSHILEHLRQLDCTLEAVIVAGESCPSSLPRDHRKILPGVALYNEYGPTEATVWSTVGELTHVSGSGPVPIGKPIPGTRVVIADDAGNPMPVGSVGEILISGPGVARGYLNRPELTKERFVEMRFNGEPLRAYRTGDLGRWLEDGSIEFLGRADDQIKIRGYRIETGEIQAAMNTHPEVAAAEVVCVQREGAPARLAGFVRSTGNDKEAFPAQLHAYLAERLPKYMVPSSIQLIDEWPFLSNGKTDRKTLARMAEDARADSARQNRPGPDAVPSPIPDSLQGILADVLGVDKVGPEDNFFALGGDSILAIQAVSRARKGGHALTVSQLLTAATLGDLEIGNQQVEQTVQTAESAVGPVPLTPIQAWLLEKPDLRHDWWNNSVLVNLDGALSTDTVVRCLETLTRHHDALRLAVNRSPTGWAQRILPYKKGLVEMEVIACEPSFRESETLITSSANRLQGSIRLSEGRLLRAAMFESSREQSRQLLLVIHHMAVDWISWKILLEDLHQLLAEAKAVRPGKLPDKTVSFRNWAEALVDYSENAALVRELEYWVNLPYSDCGSIPIESAPPGPNSECSEEIHTLSFDPTETARLLKAAKAVGISVEAVILGGLAGILGEWMKAPALQVDLEGHGREGIIGNLDTTRTIGWFTSQYPVVLVPLAHSTMRVFFKNIQAQLEEIPNKGVGFGILKYLSRMGKRLEDVPDSPIIFNYLGKLDDKAAPGLLSDARWSIGRDIDSESMRTGIFEINTFISGGCLILNWAYSKNLHQASTIERLSGKVKHFLMEAAAAVTSGDPLADTGLHEEDLQALLGDSTRQGVHG